MSWIIIKNRILYTLILIVIAGISIMPSYYGSIYLYKGYQSKNWTPTTGTVERSKFTTKLGSDSKYTTSYDFEYTYTVNGRVYSSGRNSYKAKGGDLAWVAGKIRPGEQVTVYYNPSNPEECVLEQGYSMLQMMWFLIGLVAFVFCIIGIIIVLQGKMDQSPGKKIF